MRSSLIILVVVFKFIYCAHIGFSENDELENVDKTKDLEWFETYKANLANPDAFPIQKGSVGTSEKQFFVSLLNPYNQVTSSIKEKRCKRARPELYEKYIGNPKKFHKTSLKELVGAKQRKRCDTCRESIRCKTQGKCDLCNRYCKDIDATTLPPLTAAPLLGSIHLHLGDETFATEQPLNDVAPFGKFGRYYTIGAVGPGPKQNLIVRLMNVPRNTSLEKLVVLGKPKGKLDDQNPEHPIIIDTANSFQTKDSNKKNKKIHAEVHAVDGNRLQQAIDLDLSSKIDKELDMEIEENQKSFGKSYLTGKQVDKIIDRVLSRVNSPHQPIDVINIGSRMNAISIPHITTKRSVSNWPLNKNREGTLNEPIVSARSPDSELNEDLASQNKRSNKRTAVKNQKLFLGNIVGAPRTGNNYDSYLAEDDCAEDDKRDSLENSSDTGEDLIEYELAPPTGTGEDLPEYVPAPPTDTGENIPEYVAAPPTDTGENLPEYVAAPPTDTGENLPEYVPAPPTDTGDDLPEYESAPPTNTGEDLPEYIPAPPTDTGEDLLEYEPAPPTYLDDITEYRNVNQNYSSPAPLSDFEGQTQQKTSNVLSVPISNNQKLESASQYLENPKEQPPNDSPSDTPEQKVMPTTIEEYQERVDDTDSNDHVFDGDYDDLDQEDVIVTLTQAPDTYDDNITLFNTQQHETNDSDPILGKSWISDEFDKAQVWWRTHVGMKTPQNLGSSQINENQTEQKLQTAESKTNLINASHFTLILKNLENKVENIADLVKKTCGKLNDEDENVGQQEPIFIKNYQEDKPILHSADTKARLEPAHARNHIQTIEVPDNDTNNFETIPNITETDTNTAKPSRNRPFPILDTAMKGLQEGTNFLINKAVNIADRLQEDAFSSKRIKNKPRLQAVGKDVVSAANFDRKPFLQDVVTVGCSKEDSGEYLGEPHIKKTKGKGKKQVATVASSKENSEEYVREKLNNTEESIQLRSGFEPEEPESARVAQETEENVACSKEESGEYLGAQPEIKEDTIKQQQTEPEKKKGTTKLLQNIPKISDAESPKSNDNENVACSKESDEYVGKSEQEKEGVSASPGKKSRLNLQPLGTNLNSLKQDDNNTDSKNLKQIASKPPAEVREQKKENLDQTKSGNEEAVGCSKEEEEYILPVYQPYGSNGYRKSESSSPSSSLPKYKLPHIPALDELLHRNSLPHHVREGSLTNPARKTDKTIIPKPSRLFNLNRDHIVPSAAHKSNTPEVFSSDPDHLREDSLPIPSRKTSKTILPKPSRFNLNRDDNIPSAAHQSNVPEMFSSDPDHLREDSLPIPSRKTSKTILPKPSRIFNLNRDDNVPSAAQQSNTPEVFSSDPNNLREGSLPIPSRKTSNTILPKPSRIFNLNREDNVPSTAQQPDAPEVFSSNSEDKFPNIPSDNQRFVAEPDNSRFVQDTDQPRRPSVLPFNTDALRQKPHSTILEPHDNSAFQAEPSHHQQFNAVSPLDDGNRMLSPSNPTRQHLNKVLLPPALNQRFGEQGLVGPDGFHLHRPQNLPDWPQVSSRDEVLGAKQELDANDDVSQQTSSNTQNPFSIFGKVVPQLNNTEVSFHHPSNKIYFLGTGMQLPLNMKKDDDGSYQLSVDIDKLCNNCKGSICNKKSKDQEDATTNKPYPSDETGNDAVLGMQAPSPSKEVKEVDNNKTTEIKPKLLNEGENYSEFRIEERNQSDDNGPKRISPHKIEIAAMVQDTQVPTETQTKKQTLFEHKNRQRPRNQKKHKYHSLFDVDQNDDKKHTKRSPKFDLVLPSMNNDDTVNSRVKNEAPSRNSVDLDSLDVSLKKIDDNMKRYFDRRQRLDEFYKDQVRRNLEQPDDKKDIVKRRVTLVNSVLSWMKNIAVQNSHT